MAELKPCPFCGYKGVEILADDNEHLYYRYFSQCQRCGAGAKRGHTKEDAAKEWNRRADGVHGRWDDSGRYTFPGGSTAVRCTNCGCALTESEYHLSNWNYCPVCGAKMDGGADHEAD